MSLFTRHMKNLPLLFLLLLSLLTSPAGTFGYVWCVGADGHAVLEPAMAGNCGMNDQGSPADSNVSAVLVLTADDCGPCLDVSPSHQMGSPRHRQSAIEAGVPVDSAPLLVTFPLHIDPSLSEPFHDAPPPRTPEPIRHHRTIVLLI